MEARMLVLSRQRDETVMIGDDIEVTVEEIRGDKVRLSVIAPEAISVHRKEVYERIQKENKACGFVLADIATLGGLVGKPTRKGGGKLVLTRQQDETIMIGDDIEVTVVDIRGDKVRLGLTAPKAIAVHRKEVYERIQKEKRESSKKRPLDAARLDPNKLK